MRFMAPYGWYDPVDDPPPAYWNRHTAWNAIKAFLVLGSIFFAMLALTLYG